MQYIKTRLPSASEEYHNHQEVYATGKLKEYKERAEMILSTQTEIRIF